MKWSFTYSRLHLFVSYTLTVFQSVFVCVGVCASVGAFRIVHWVRCMNVRNWMLLRFGHAHMYKLWFQKEKKP